MDVASDADPTEPGVFSEVGPWRIDLARISWRAGIDELRAKTRAEVPVRIRRRGLPPVGRFATAFWHMLVAVGGWLVFERRKSPEVSRAGLSRRLRIAFEQLGSAYIKLGQIVSSGRGMFPDELVEEFKRCRDQVPPQDFATVRSIVEEDLGRPLEEVFERFDRESLAAASIAQVHSARLLSGEEVVVKVQRREVARLVRRDIEAMAWMAPFLVGRIPVAALANPPALVELFAETILEELDFRLEAQNMLDIARLLLDAGQKIIVVPRPHPDLVTRRVLVMERLSGLDYDDAQGIRAAGIDTKALIRSLLVSFLEGAMIYGVFHGDLHGGNLLVMPDGRVALFDYGITARMDHKQRLGFLRMMMTGAANDVRGQLEAFVDLGALPADADLDGLMRLLKVDRPVRDPTKMSSSQLASELREILGGLLANGAKLPKHLMLYVKNMLFIDGAIAELAPDLDMFAEMIHVYGYFAANHSEQILSEIGFDPSRQTFDLSGVRRGLGIEGEVESLSHAEVRQRREILRERFEEGL